MVRHRSNSYERGEARSALARSRLLRLLMLAALGAVALMVGGGGSPLAATTATTLNGNVGPGYVISLTDSTGAAVTSLPAGSYTIMVNDQSSSHNFHLSGPGVNQTTTVSCVGMAT